MPTSRDIQLSRLRLDPINPRLDDGKQTQPEALQAMMAAQGQKLVTLARDIAHNGLSPLDRFLVIEAEDIEDEYIVLEGNRRLAALKLLLNPDLGTGYLTQAEIRALRKLSPSASYQADSDMDCVIVDNRDEAIHWLRLRHGGQLDGAGTVDWGATERDRFESRAGKSSPELQVLQFAVAQNAVSEDQADLVSITNLRRLLSDKQVRDTIGLEIDRSGGKISTRYPATEVLKPIKKLLTDLASDDFVVGNIYTKEDRAEYMKGFGRNNKPDPKTQRPASAPLSASASVQLGGKQKKTGGRVKARRKTVAPATLPLRIPQSRLKDIYRELQRLKVEDHANAGAVLLRVFLELTVDHFLKSKGIAPKPGDTLAKRLQKVHDELLAAGTMTTAELAPIRKAISGNDLIAASVPLFNLYVHDLNLTPSPSDVRAAWDNLELFFVRIWI